VFSNPIEKIEDDERLIGALFCIAGFKQAAGRHLQDSDWQSHVARRM